MSRRLLPASLMIATLLSSSMAFASPFHSAKPDSAKAIKVKPIHLSLRNDDRQDVTVMVGSTELTLAPGQTTRTDVNEGDKVVAGSGLIVAEGTLLIVATRQVNHATLAIK